MRRVNADPALAGLLALLGAAMAVFSVRYGIFGEGGRIGPGFMPCVAGTGMALFATWSCAETVLRARRKQRQDGATAVNSASSGSAVDAASSEPRNADEPEGAEGVVTAALSPPPPVPRTGRKLVLVFALAVAAAALTPLTGFLIAFGLLILVLLAAVEREPLWLSATVTVATVAVSWLVFVRLLGVPLPGGAMGLLGS